MSCGKEDGDESNDDDDDEHDVLVLGGPNAKSTALSDKLSVSNNVPSISKRIALIFRRCDEGILVVGGGDGDGALAAAFQYVASWSTSKYRLAMRLLIVGLFSSKIHCVSKEHCTWIFTVRRSGKDLGAGKSHPSRFLQDLCECVYSTYSTVRMAIGWIFVCLTADQLSLRFFDRFPSTPFDYDPSSSSSFALTL